MQTKNRTGGCIFKKSTESLCLIYRGAELTPVVT